MPKAWIVTNVKDWVMTELAKGSTQECRDAIEEAMTAAHDPGLDAKGVSQCHNVTLSRNIYIYRLHITRARCQRCHGSVDS